MAKCDLWNIYLQGENNNALIVSNDILIYDNGAVRKMDGPPGWTHDCDDKHIKKSTPDDLLKYISKCKDEETREIIKKRLKEIL